jgi:hypothetical protein
MSMRSVDNEVPSAAIGVGTKVARVPTAGPDTEVAMKTKHPVSPVPEAEISNAPEVSVLAIATVTTPLSGVTVPVGVAVPMFGVLFETWMSGVLAFATVFPLTSLRLTVIVDVPPVSPPFATTAVGAAVHVSCDAGP